MNPHELRKSAHTLSTQPKITDEEIAKERERERLKQMWAKIAQGYPFNLPEFLGGED